MLAATILSPHFTRKQTSPGVAGRAAQGANADIGQAAVEAGYEYTASHVPKRRLRPSPSAQPPVRVTVHLCACWTRWDSSSQLGRGRHHLSAYLIRKASF